MELLIKQRVFSWTDTYDVYDEQEVAKYYVKAKAFSLRQVIHIYRCDNGQEVGLIRKKLFTMLPKFEMEINGQVVGTICKEFTLLKPRYRISCNDWAVEGNMMGWNYKVISGNAEIMNISKKLLSWGDTYVLDIYNSRDEVMCLMLAIAIDAENAQQNQGFVNGS